MDPMPIPQIVRVIDLETTGNAPPAHAVIEIGWQDVSLGRDGRWALDGDGGAIFVNPGRPIPPVTQAVHHILDEQVADAPWSRPLSAPPRAGGAPGEFRGTVLHAQPDGRRGLDLHLEMRAQAMARQPRLLQPGAALLAQAAGNRA